MDNHLNGRYCTRTLLSSKDAEVYKPNKIFQSMYQKQYPEASRQ